MRMGTRLKPISAAVMYLPGFAPDEDPLELRSIKQETSLALAGPESIVLAPAAAPVAAQRPMVVKANRKVWCELSASDLAPSGLGYEDRIELNLAALRGAIGGKPCTRQDLTRYTGWGAIPKVFDDPRYEAARQEMEALMGAEGYVSAKSSVNTSFFTPIEVCKAVWHWIEQAGFEGGHILEPSAGVGNLIGTMPKAIAERSSVVAIEKDGASAAILRQLYGESGVKVHAEGFEAVALAEGSFDLVISNVPFGKFGVPESKNKAYKNWLIHDYFFGKSMELVRPGGLIALLTSRGTLDKGTEGVRRWLAIHGDLVGAVRLPVETFKDYAGTEACVDLVLLRKREALGDGKADWVKQNYTRVGHLHTFINRVFMSGGSGRVVGELKPATSRYETIAQSTSPDWRVDLSKALAEYAIPKCYAPLVRERKDEPALRVRIAKHKPGCYLLVDGELMMSMGHEAERVALKKDDAARVTAMLPLRETLRALVKAQVEIEDEGPLEALRRQLHMQYDAFVKAFGALGERKNVAALRADADFPLLMGLEKVGEDGKTIKADLFYRRTARSSTSATSAASLPEALQVNLAESGQIQVGRLAGLLGWSIEEVTAGLVADGLAFQCPVSHVWEPTFIYLSGDVKAKLAAAEAAGEGYAPNVTALKAVVPADIEAHEISIRLGATWIPADVYAEFASEALETKVIPFYAASAGLWSSNERYLHGGSPTHGTHKISAGKLFMLAMNQKEPQITDRIEGKAVVNVPETLAAKEKQQLIREKFVNWLWASEKRKQRIVRAYNDTMNRHVEPAWDGSLLTLPGFSDCVRLHQHQKDAIWRTVVSANNTLLAHCVGAGKAQPLDASVLTPRGFVRMGDIKVGDEVMSVDGRPTRVVGVFPQGEKDIYRVTFSDGSSTECCDEHLWLTQTYYERNASREANRLGRRWPVGDAKVRSLSEIRSTLKAPHLGAKNHSVPMVDAVEFEERPVPVDPYLMGAMIGDGTVAGKSSQLATDDVEIVERCKAGLDPSLEMVKLKAPFMWSIRQRKMTGYGSEKSKNLFREAMEKMGLQGCDSFTKFIPEVYLINSTKVRLALLQGLMDTDGWVQSTSCYFSTASEEIAKGVRFLVESMGGTVSWKLKRPHFKDKNGDRKQGAVANVLCIRLPPEINPFHLERKAKAVTPKSRYRPVRYITGVEFVGRKESQCIAVDHPTHLYVTDRFIVTHNTLSMICAGMELRRVGKARKPMYVVPNHMLEQFAAEFLRAYPGASVLMACKEDLAKDRRKQLTAKIALWDWDAIIITHSSFEKITASSDLVKGYIDNALRQIEAVIEACDDSSRKEIEAQKSSLENKLLKLTSKDRKDDLLEFKELGVDMLFVDEAHLFKNVWRMTRMTRVAGLPITESQRAFDMLMKVREIEAIRGDRKGVVFATGTPVANSLAELWVMQNFLQPHDLEALGFNHFDSWAANFGEAVTGIEVRPDGGGYRVNTRFARFINLPEIMAIFKQVADIKTKEMLNLPTPMIEKVTVAAKGSPALKAYVERLVERVEKIKSGEVKPAEDNMLAVTTDGRKAATDMRLVHGCDEPGSKINLCIAKIHKEWLESASSCGTQIVFLDLSTPGTGHWSLYDDIKDKLIGLGVPAKEIAFIHDAATDKAKEALFERVREGDVRVLIGSTSKMGVGTNVQKRLVALHHIDAPWRPADVEQREGRIERQGNLNASARVYRYVTEGSFDAYMWQTLETKAKFIAQVMSGGKLRTVEDLEMSALSYSEVKALASGNPLVIEKAGVDADLNRLVLLRKQWVDQNAKLRWDARQLPLSIQSCKDRIKAAKKDAERLIDVRGQEFFIVLDGKRITDRREAASKLLLAIYQANPHRGPQHLGQYAGFDLLVESIVSDTRFILKGEGFYPTQAKLTPANVLTELLDVVREIETTVDRSEAYLEKLNSQLARIESQLNDAAWEHEAKFRRLIERQAEIDALLGIGQAAHAAFSDDLEAAA